MLNIDDNLKPADLCPAIARMWECSAPKMRSLLKSCPAEKPAPVFTVKGQYVSRSWTEWTRGFQYGSALLQFDATGVKRFLDLAQAEILQAMPAQITHRGVHDHGFNIVSTYGNLWRLMNEGAIAEDAWQRPYYELALKCSGAVQAMRWTALASGGFIHSFNGSHSLFADTIRTLRSLALAHKLGHVLLSENDEHVNLLARLVHHARATAQFNVYYGDGRDAFDVPGRVAHESIFNTADGQYRCPSTQQGYSPLSTWTRGLAWIMLGFAEQLEFLATLNDAEFKPIGPRREVESFLLKAARAACDFYIANTPTDGVPYWDSGAPGLTKMGDYLDRPSEPFNDYEPVDSSAAATACQGLLRLGRYLSGSRVGWVEERSDEAHLRTPRKVGLAGQTAAGSTQPTARRVAQPPSAVRAGGRYFQAGLSVLKTLLGEPYLSAAPRHQGLLLHSVYHRPRGWDYVPPGRKIPCGESSMWGDYHLREAALYVQRLGNRKRYLTFF